MEFIDEFPTLLVTGKALKPGKEVGSAQLDVCEGRCSARAETHHETGNSVALEKLIEPAVNRNELELPVVVDKLCRHGELGVCRVWSLCVRRLPVLPNYYFAFESAPLSAQAPFVSPHHFNPGFAYCSTADTFTEA